MNPLKITRHATIRMSQRGIAKADAELIALIGTEVDDGYMVREKDYREFEHELKRLLRSSRRLVGKRLVVKDGQIVTAYHSTLGHERRLLRCARDTSQS